MGRLLSVDEAAARMRVKKSTLHSWRGTGKGPTGAVLGRNLVYREDDVERWIAERFEAAESKKGA